MNNKAPKPMNSPTVHRGSRPTGSPSSNRGGAQRTGGMQRNGRKKGGCGCK